MNIVELKNFNVRVAVNFLEKIRKIPIDSAGLKILNVSPGAR